MTLQTAYDAFRKGYIETRLRPTTAEGYMTNMKLHVLPSLGGCDRPTVFFMAVNEQIKLFFIALTIGEIYLLIGILLLKLGGL